MLAEGEFFRVGGRELIRVDVRVIAATHQDLEALVADGRFRADLLHRLDVVRLRLPPLRERRDDVAAAGASASSPAPRARSARRPSASRSRRWSALRAHDWPGNVRELENLCWRLAALAPGETITASDLEGALSANVRRCRAAGAGQWDQALAAWAHARLERRRRRPARRGARAFSTAPCWKSRCSSPMAAAPKPPASWAWAAIR